MAQKKLDKFQDALNEMGNIGSGKASGQLSRLINKEVALKSPELYLTTMDSVPKLIGGDSKMVVGAYSVVSGDLSGTVLTVLPTKSALGLVDIVSKRRIGSSKHLGKREQAKIRKSGKLLSKAYVSTIEKFLELDITTSEERIIATFGESLIDFVLMGVKGDKALLLMTEFSVPDTQIEGDFIMLLALDSVTKAKEALRKKLE